MATIPNGTLTTLLDSMASGKLIYDNAVGTSSSQANTTAKAANNDIATLVAVADPQVQNDLMPAFYLRSQNVLATSLYATLSGYQLWWALDKHVGGLDAYLNAQNIRVSTHVAQLGFPLSAAQVMPPATAMATFAVTGAGAGTYTHVADIDTTQYGRAWLAVTVTNSSGIGPQTIQATITGKQIDNTTTTSKIVAIAAGSSSGAVVNVGVLGTQADSYDYLTNVTITGGTNGDTFSVSSRVERTISAVA